MKCADFLSELTNYLDGVIDARTKAELEDHLAWCHNCYVVVCEYDQEDDRDLPRLSTLTNFRKTFFAPAFALPSSPSVMPARRPVRSGFELCASRLISYLPVSFRIRNCNVLIGFVTIDSWRNLYLAVGISGDSCRRQFDGLYKLLVSQGKGSEAVGCGGQTTDRKIKSMLLSSVVGTITIVFLSFSLKAASRKGSRPSHSGRR